MVRLGKRLQCIHDLVNDHSIIADIGCDHGLLCIALIESHTAIKAYACDVANGPLDRAKEAIRTAGLQDRITPMLADGIAQVPPEADTIIIAGMGFETIRKILLEGRNRWGNGRTFILASHTDVEDLRRFLSDHHFVIDDERIVLERHYYQIIKAHHDEEARSLTEDEILFGVYAKNEKLFLSYWQKEKKKCEEILRKMPSSHERYPSVKQRYLRIESMMQR